MDKEKIAKKDNKKQAPRNIQEDVVEKAPKMETEKLIFSWTAPARPFKRRDRDFWVTIIVISAIVGLILFFAEGFMPVILIISVIFLYYILSTVEPENIEYKITTWGVKMADKLNTWDKLGRFWFTKRFNDELLVFEALTLGGRLEVVIKHADKEKIKKILTRYLLHEQASPSVFDKASNWFSKKLPGV
jgi:hypothetical protein